MTKKKTLIFQIDIDVGTQWGDEPVGKFIREYCIPSVKKYCTNTDTIISYLLRANMKNMGVNLIFIS